MLKSVDAGEDDDAVDDAVDDAGVVVVDAVETVDGLFSFLMHLVGATSNSISGITAMLVVAFCAHFCS